MENPKPNPYFLILLELRDILGVAPDSDSRFYAQKVVNDLRTANERIAELEAQCTNQNFQKLPFDPIAPMRAAHTYAELQAQAAAQGGIAMSLDDWTSNLSERLALSSTYLREAHERLADFEAMQQECARLQQKEAQDILRAETAERALSILQAQHDVLASKLYAQTPEQVKVWQEDEARMEFVSEANNYVRFNRGSRMWEANYLNADLQPCAAYGQTASEAIDAARNAHKPA